MIDPGATAIGWAMTGLAVAGIGYQLAAAWLVERTLRARAAPPGPFPAVTILKPLHGAEPRLAANLASFAAQDYSAPVQLVCGVGSADDPALAAVAALRAGVPSVDLALVVDSARHGSNAKVSNLINMLPAATHDVLVLSDSDMVAAPDYLARVIAVLEAPDVGAVTCLYHGRGDAGLWSRLAAMGISHGFLPSVVVGRALGLAHPCMGSTIALRRATLAGIGGFAAVADVLADDHAIGAGVRRLGLTVAVPGFTLAHACAETSLAELARHELRWNATIRRLDPWGYAGAGLVNPLPLAVIATLLWLPAWPSVVAALAARIAVAASVDRATRSHAGSLWLLPLRDFLSFGLFFGGFLVQSVDWRGSRLRVDPHGTITTD